MSRKTQRLERSERSIASRPELVRIAGVWNCKKKIWRRWMEKVDGEGKVEIYEPLHTNLSGS